MLLAYGIEMVTSRLKKFRYGPKWTAGPAGRALFMADAPSCRPMVITVSSHKQSMVSLGSLIGTAVAKVNPSGLSG